MVVGESAINVSMRSTIPLSRTARRGISKSTIAGVINEKESKLRSLKSTSEVEHEIVENKCSKLQRCQVSCATANSRPEASFVIVGLQLRVFVCLTPGMSAFSGHAGESSSPKMSVVSVQSKGDSDCQCPNSLGSLRSCSVCTSEHEMSSGSWQSWKGNPDALTEWQAQEWEEQNQYWNWHGGQSHSEEVDAASAWKWTEEKIARRRNRRAERCTAKVSPRSK